MSLASQTYEEYLDSKVSNADRAYLDSVDIQRALVSLGYRGSGDTLKRADFEQRQLMERQQHLHREIAPKPLAGAGREYPGRPLLAALAAREELVRNGKLLTIIFLRDMNSKGQEVSGYIDFAHRLKLQPWEPIFEGREKLGASVTCCVGFDAATSHPSPPASLSPQPRGPPTYHTITGTLAFRQVIHLLIFLRKQTAGSQA